MQIRLRSLVLLIAALCAAPLSVRAAIQLQPGIGFVVVTGGTEGTPLVLEQAGQFLVQGTVDRLGSLAFPFLEQGAAYVVRNPATGETASATTLRFVDHPPAAFYQTHPPLQEGFQYIRTRDGTLLSAMVRPPLGKTMAQGPFPTVVEYSGYSVSDPGHTEPSSQIAGALGFATVGVNMRGSGCSGGVMDLFDLPTTADGYDIIETVAAQSWVQGKVGMVGISFPGISQTFVGGANPPHLAAITPFSVIADIYRAPGFPGGIFNNGFAQSWLEERKRDAQPAPEGGQSWARRRVREGDAVCLANQAQRLQTIDAVSFTKDHPFYEASLMANRSPINWVGNIQVPTYLAGAWQDEQTGPDFASMLRALPRRRDVKITVTNGVHTSALDPEILWNWAAFLDLYVAHRIPNASFLKLISPIIYSSILEGGAPPPPTPDDRFAGITDYETALALFEADPPVRVLVENGAGSPTPGLPAPTFELGFKRWPPPQSHPTEFFFGPDGALLRQRPRLEAIDAYRPDPAARPQTTLQNGGDWNTLPPFDWRPLVDGTALAYATAPLARDVVVAGPGSVDLWLRSSAADTDLQVTLSEIRPDGKEMYVQSGWLRASHRKLDRKTSTRVSPRPTHLEEDAEPMPAGEFARVRVPLYSVTHVFRAGSRIRLSIEAPGGDRTSWAFDTPATGGTVLNEVVRGGRRGSRVVLSIVPRVEPPPALPPCPSLRGQPCRGYVPAANGG